MPYYFIPSVVSSFLSFFQVMSFVKTKFDFAKIKHIFIKILIKLPFKHLTYSTVIK